MARLAWIVAPCLCGLAASAGAGDEKAAPTGAAFTETFFEKDEDLVSRGRNPFFVLEPGWRLTLEGREGKTNARLVVTVLDETRRIGAVETRVVEERETEDGELSEVSRNYFAISKRTNAVYYFGEDVDEYEDGKVARHPGAWVAGKDGARYGLMMAGSPLLGARYAQEVAPNVAMDRAEVVGVSATFDAPSGTLEHCLDVEETSPLEPGRRERKLYAPGVGLVRDGSLRLVKAELAVLDAKKAEPAPLEWKTVTELAALRAEVDGARAARKAMVVAVWAPWCTYCIRYDRLIAEDEALRAGFERLVRVKIDVGEDGRDALRRSLGIPPNVQPYMVFFSPEGSRVPSLDVDAFYGAESKDQLRRRLDAVLPAK